LFVPLVWSIYRRRTMLIDYLRSLPNTIEVDVFGMAYAVDLPSLVPLAREFITAAIIENASTATILASSSCSSSAGRGRRPATSAGHGGPGGGRPGVLENLAPLPDPGWLSLPKIHLCNGVSATKVI
jgi:hypothetical protein